MKTLQITFACLILLVGQVVLSDARNPKPVIIPAPGWRKYQLGTFR